MLYRRDAVLLLALSPWPVLAAESVVPLLRRGGVAVLMRHAQTVSGVGDPPGFRLGDCSTQRNLSDAGREQARRSGQWFASQGLAPARVRSSAWCRCLDTARLAFGQAEPWPALNSFFDDRGTEPRQTAELRAALRDVPRGRFEVWVTHQVNITALTGEGTSMGEAVVVEPGADAPRVLGRIAPA